MKLFILLLLFPMSLFAATKQNSSDWNFGVGANFNLNSHLVFSDIDQSNLTADISADIEYNNYLSVSFEARHLPQQAWGFMGGLIYEFERNQNGGSITINGTSISASSGNSKLQTTLLYGNLAYRGDEFYVPFGLNYSFPNFTADPTSTSTAKTTGGIGLQLGFGVYVNPQFALEGYYQATAVKITATAPTFTADYNTGYATTLSVGAKYFF